MTKLPRLVAGAVVVFLTSGSVFGQEHEAAPIQGTIGVEPGADLQALAKITGAEAVATALVRFPGSLVRKWELKSEDSYLIYEVELVHSGDEVDVLVDAGDGSILRVDQEDEDLMAKEADEEYEGGEEINDAEDAGVGELPEGVEAAFRASYPKAEIIGSHIEKEGGKTYFEIESRDGATKRDLLFLGDGTLVETEEAVATSSLPAAVRRAAAERGRVLKAERTARADTIEFEVLVEDGNGRHELILDEEGRIVTR